MSRDVFVSLSGAMASWNHLEALAQNLSNVTTPGFKEQRVAFSLSNIPGDPYGQAYANIGTTERDFADGPLIRDGNPCHLALQGRGFFVVSNGAGIDLMRAGSFMLDQDGFLVTADGSRVQGREGDIRFPDEMKDFMVTEDGVIIDDQQTQVGQLLLVDGDDPEPTGEGRWAVKGSVRDAEGVKVQQGALEGSNANAVRCMVELIENSRIFEMYQKSIDTSNEMDRQLASMEQR